MPLILKQWASVVDKRTTVVCLHAAGQIRRVEEPFETLAGDFQAPPAHIHCRSIVRPWLTGFVNTERSLANAELQRRPLPERRIGPGGEIGGRIPPPPATRAPIPMELLTPRAVERFPTRGLDDLIAAAGQPVTVDRARNLRIGYPTPLEDAVAAWETSGTAERINRRLRQGGSLRKSDEALLRQLDDVAARSTFTEDTTLYRGLSLSVDEYARLSRTGAQWIDYGFVSASVDRDVAEEAAAAGSGLVSAVLVILAPAGTRAFVGAPMFGEVVLARGTRFEVVSASGEEIVVRVMGRA